MNIKRILLILFLFQCIKINLLSQIHGNSERESINKMREMELQPERILDVIKLTAGMNIGEAGAGYGFFTFYLSKRVGANGFVYANDIDSAALREISMRCKSEEITNIRTVLGKVDDPYFQVKNLDFVVVFDCLFEFDNPSVWLKNTKKYLKPGGKLVIIDPDPSRMKSDHFLSRKQINDFALESGYLIIKADDSFLKSHMIIVLQSKITN